MVELLLANQAEVLEQLREVAALGRELVRLVKVQMGAS